MSGFRFPSAFTILFLLIAIVAVLTWIVPAGLYDMAFNEALGRDAPVPGTFHAVEQSPQGWTDVLLAPIRGLYDPIEYTANAIDISLFVLVIGGFLMVVTRTGAIDAGIGGLLKALQGREILMIPILMTAFALGGTTYGMAEETLAFYTILIPVMIRAGYDSPTAVATILLGAGIGTMGSTFNAFATVIASNAAGTTIQDGLFLRVVILFASLAAGIAYVMRYASRVKADPSKSLVADNLEEHRAHFLKGGADAELPEFTRVRSIILSLFGLTFLIMLWGVIWQDWWMGEMTALFLGMSIVIWAVGKFSAETAMNEQEFADAFVDGARDLLGVALIIGVARGIVVVMDDGQITHTILNSLEGMLGGLSEISFINTMFGVNIVLSFLVPSSSGLAVLTMPILAPLSDFAGVSRDLTVTAYQSASGWVNLFNPTFAVVMGALAIGKVSYDKWLRFVFPLLVVLAIIVAVVLSIGALSTDSAAPEPAKTTAIDESGTSGN
ncbi:YfcC family protein [Lutimaribacter marinistellae]|uniref:YfcC family protein n=1 Tax=Lutimaribacter marinistellae TaxID=1820329 RepID=A0ABV7TJA8_9RHOB